MRPKRKTRPTAPQIESTRKTLAAVLRQNLIIGIALGTAVRQKNMPKVMKNLRRAQTSYWHFVERDTALLPEKESDAMQRCLLRRQG